MIVNVLNIFLLCLVEGSYRFLVFLKLLFCTKCVVINSKISILNYAFVKKRMKVVNLKCVLLKSHIN